MDSLAREELASLRDILEKKDIKTHIEALPELEVYPCFAKLIFRTLISNAIHQSKNSLSEIRIESKKADSKTVFVFIEKHRSLNNAKAFKRTSIASNTEPPATSDAIKTQLTICKRAIERHLGLWWTEHKGNDFYFNFTLNT